MSVDLEKISVFGGTGFIGGNFCKMYTRQTQIIPRNETKSISGHILYFTSTIDNYNVFKNVNLDINTNLNLLVNILEKNKDISNFEFNFISSWFVYGEQKILPVKETAYCNPKGFYSITKRTAEQLLISFCETFGLNYRIIRLCNVYGVSDKKFSKKRNALQYLANELANGNDIYLYNNGSDIRDFMHVDDVCVAINDVICKGKLNQIYNVGSGIPNNFKDMMLFVKRESKSKGKIIPMNPPDFHKIVQVKDFLLEISKLKKLGFKQSIDIKSGLKLLIK